MMQDAVHFAPAAMATLASAGVLEADLKRKQVGHDWNVLVLCMLPNLMVWASAVSRNLAALTVAMSLAALVVSWVQARIASWQRFIYLDVFPPAAIVAIGISSTQVLINGEELGISLLQVSGYLATGLYLWSEGGKAHQWQRPRGMVFGEFLVLSSMLIVLVKIASRNRISHGADLALTLLLLVSGMLTVLLTLIPYTRTKEEHRILNGRELVGSWMQPEYASPSRECPQPQHWAMYDSMSAEVEVLDFLEALVSTIKPRLIVETGTFAGLSTIKMAQGLRKNGFGKLISLELDAHVFAKAKSRIEESGLSEWIELRNESSLQATIVGEIDLLFSDTKSEIREREVRRFLGQISPHGIVLMHDSASNLKIVREAVLRMEAEGLISAVFLPTPRGLAIAQKSVRAA